MNLHISSFTVFYNQVEYLLQSNSLVYYGTAEYHRPIIRVMTTYYPTRDFETVFTYGLSSAKRKEWAEARPELVLCLDSTDRDWTVMLADAAWVLRGQQPTPPLPSIVDFETSLGRLTGFDYNHPDLVQEASAMTAFLVASPRLFSPELRFELPDRELQLWQTYPIYPEEISVIQQAGAECFLDHLGDAVYSVRRSPVSALPVGGTVEPIPVYTKAAALAIRQPRVRQINQQKLIRSVMPLFELVAARDADGLRPYFPGTDEEWALVIEEYLDYPATFTLPPRSRWRELIDLAEPLDIPGPTQWEVDITLWSIEEGPSNLSMQLRVVESPGDCYETALLGLHVM